MSISVGIISGRNAQLEQLVNSAGMRAVVLQVADFTGQGRALATAPDVVLVDVRQGREPLAIIPNIKRRHPHMGIAIVVPSLDPALMLEAMRAGVTECITEPLTQAALEDAVSRVSVQRTSHAEGRLFAVIGSKGGVGTTMIAVNLAEAVARKLGETLLIDLQPTGDAAIFLGTEPRFTVGEALENTHRLDKAFFHGLVVRMRSGLDLLGSSTRVASGHPLDINRLRQLLDFALHTYRAVVIDVPRDSPLLESLDASGVFIVVNHELPSVRNAYRLVTRLRPRYGERLSLIVNRHDRNAEISIADIEKATNAKVKHTFPSDYKQALAAMNRGELLVQSPGRLASSFQAFADALTVDKAQPRVEEEGGRLFGWLAPRRSTAD